MEVGTKVQIHPRAFFEDNIKVPRTGKVVKCPYKLSKREVAVDLRFPTLYGSQRVFDKLFINKMG